MQLKEADEILAKMAEGTYRSIRYERTTHEGGNIVVECSVYIVGPGWRTAPTWQEALDALSHSNKEEPQNIEG